MKTSSLEEAVSVLAAPRSGRMGLWRGIGLLVAAGHAPLVRRCCAVWARHVVLRCFEGPAPNRRILHRSCRFAYRYAAGRAEDRDIYIARCQAETIARESTGPSFEVARAVSRACAFPGMPDSMESEVAPDWYAAAFWDVPWCASRTTNRPRPAWEAYHRHLLRAAERQMREQRGGAPEESEKS